MTEIDLMCITFLLIISVGCVKILLECLLRVHRPKPQDPIIFSKSIELPKASIIIAQEPRLENSGGEVKIPPKTIEKHHRELR